VISLVVGTVNRTVELDHLLTSLEQQTYKDFEVLIVDQNSDGRLSAILEKHRNLQIRHLHSERGLSRARNVGLAAATGSICAVPDDDCWYPPEHLHLVSSWFSENPDFDVLLASVSDECGNTQGPRRRSRFGCACNKYNIWYNGISYNAFWRRSVVDDVKAFDELIGPGCETAFQSGEETDFFLRALSFGHRIWYEPGLCVFHPSPRSIQQRILEQTYPYALGTGYVLRKHGYSTYRLFKDFLAYSFGGAVVSMCRADISVARVRLLRGLGQVVGYVSARPLVRQPIRT
jgi:glycosyltransferase involved in cell wall biosynthesis